VSIILPWYKLVRLLSGTTLRLGNWKITYMFNSPMKSSKFSMPFNSRVRCINFTFDVSKLDLKLLLEESESDLYETPVEFAACTLCPKLLSPKCLNSSVLCGEGVMFRYLMLVL
jgi:hypothetical protein